MLFENSVDRFNESLFHLSQQSFVSSFSVLILFLELVISGGFDSLEATNEFDMVVKSSVHQGTAFLERGVEDDGLVDDLDL